MSCLNGKVYQAEEDAHVAKEVTEKAQEEAAQSRARKRLLRLRRKQRGIRARPST